MYSVYWVGKGRTGNFGDVLTPHLLDYFKIDHTFTSKPPADLICIGSIARHATAKTTVLGSGFISQKNPINPNANYKFVRGPLTRNMILAKGGNCPSLYGDPAMLLPLFCDESKKEHEVGIIPHIWHYKEVSEAYPKHNVIQLWTSNALDVAKEISKCKYIISSSLHGIIAAHAYGIPAAWVDFGYLKGDGMKFQDHFLSLGITNAEKSTVKDPKFYSGSLNIKPLVSIFEGLK
jgi:pyruvyltransferase